MPPPSSSWLWSSQPPVCFAWLIWIHTARLFVGFLCLLHSLVSLDFSVLGCLFLLVRVLYCLLLLLLQRLSSFHQLRLLLFLVFALRHVAYLVSLIHQALFFLLQLTHSRTRRLR